MDKDSRQSSVHRVSKSWTKLKQLSMHQVLLLPSAAKKKKKAYYYKMINHIGTHVIFILNKILKK